MENLFDKPVKRRGTGSLKWDVAENELPMWVADIQRACPTRIWQSWPMYFS